MTERDEMVRTYIKTNFRPDDRLAAVLIQKRSGAVVQRIEPAVYAEFDHDAGTRVLAMQSRSDMPQPNDLWRFRRLFGPREESQSMSNNSELTSEEREPLLERRKTKTADEADEASVASTNGFTKDGARNQLSSHGTLHDAAKSIVQLIFGHYTRINRLGRSPSRDWKPVSHVFDRNKKAEQIQRALDVLKSKGLATCVKQEGSNRLIERWRAA